MGKSNTEIFIGMDVSEKNIEIYVLPGHLDEGAKARIANRFKAVDEFIAAVRKETGGKRGIAVVLETGTHSNWLAELLRARHCRVLVGHARKLRMIWNVDNKCDARDAEMLARIARFDTKLLHPVKLKSSARRIDLTILKARDTLVKTATLLKNHVRGSLRSFGVDLEAVSSDNFPDTAKARIPRELSGALNGLIKQIKSLHAEIKRYDRKLEKLCGKYPELERLRQVKGVGPVTALAFALVVETPRRFPVGTHLSSYLGLVPKRDQSGATEKQLGITKAGNGLLRRCLVQSANYIMGPFGEDCDLRRFGERIASRGGKIARRKAKVAVARKLALTLRALWLSGDAYDPDYRIKCRQARPGKTAA